MKLFHIRVFSAAGKELRGYMTYASSELNAKGYTLCRYASRFNKLARGFTITSEQVF